MKKFINNINQWINDSGLRYWLPSIVLIIVALFIVYHYTSDRHNKIGPADLSLKPTIIYKDKDGNQRSNITGVIVSEDEFKRITDSFKLLLQDKRVEIQEVTKYVNIVDTVIKKLTIYKDTSDNFQFSHKDDYISLSAYGNYRTGEGNFHLRGIDTITHISYTKKRFLRSNETKVNLSNSSPYYTITEGANITLKEPKAIITFGPQVGVTYTSGKVKPYIGIGVSWNLWSIKTKR